MVAQIQMLVVVTFVTHRAVLLQLFVLMFFMSPLLLISRACAKGC